MPSDIPFICYYLLFDRFIFIKNVIYAEKNRYPGIELVTWPAWFMALRKTFSSRYWHFAFDTVCIYKIPESALQILVILFIISSYFIALENIFFLFWSTKSYLLHKVFVTTYYICDYHLLWNSIREPSKGSCSSRAFHTPPLAHISLVKNPM